MNIRRAKEKDISRLIDLMKRTYVLTGGAKHDYQKS